MTPQDGPVVFIDGGDVRVFASLPDAIDSVEAIDLMDPGVALFDSLGARIHLSETPDGDVVLDSTQYDEQEAADVRRKLAGHMQQRLRCRDVVPGPDVLDSMTIAELNQVLLKCYEALSFRSRLNSVLARFTRS
jgi:hypothetical protein